MNHPLEHAFVGITALKDVVGPAWLVEKPPGLQGRFAVRDNEQSRPVSTQTRDLNVSSVLVDCGICEGVHFLHLRKLSATQHIVEDHGKAESSDSNRIGGLVLHVETQNKPAAFDQPASRYLERTIGRKRSSEVSGGKNGRCCSQRLDGPARRTRGIVLPYTGIPDADSKCDVPQRIESVACATVQAICRCEIETI